MFMQQDLEALTLGLYRKYNNVVMYIEKVWVHDAMLPWPCHPSNTAALVETNDPTL